MAQPDQPGAPWKDIRSLHALMSYWKDHAADFRDAARRDGALAAAALAIKESSGEEISPKQILTKFSKMWERKRTAEYQYMSGGPKTIFLIGPQCLDLVKLRLELPTAESTEPPTGREKEDGQELALHTKSQLEISEKDLSPCIQAEEEQIRKLKEQLRSIQKENSGLKEAVQAKDSEIQILRESRLVHEQISSSAIKDRGPFDKEVRERVQTITNLIRLNTNGPSSEFSEKGSLLSFSEMKRRHGALYELHQQAYCFDLEDDITLMRLGILGIQTVEKNYLLRALIGADLLQTVFRSSFPDFFHDRGSAALIYERVIEEQCENLFPLTDMYLHGNGAGPLARDILIQSAQYSYIKSSKFSDRIVPAKASRMSQILNDLLSPLRETPISDGSPPSRDIWDVQEQTLQDIFVQSLMLRAELRLNLDRYEFFWPPPNTPFSKAAMTSDNAEATVKSFKELKVTITLFPGIRAWDSESIVRLGSLETDGEDGSRVVVKAMVLTH